jgi:hypothetical protein
MLNSLDRPDEAMTHYRKILGSDPSSVEARRSADASPACRPAPSSGDGSDCRRIRRRKSRRSKKRHADRIAAAHCSGRPHAGRKRPPSGGPSVEGGNAPERASNFEATCVFQATRGTLRRLRSTIAEPLPHCSRFRIILRGFRVSSVFLIRPAKLKPISPLIRERLRGSLASWYGSACI